jgi:hypothetical protein
MYYPSPEYFKQLQVRFLQMEEAIAELQSELAALESENKQIRKKMADIKPIHIENLNYKIQELGVQELKGTLNIGMTALSDAEQIQKIIRESETGESVQLHDMETEDPNESEPYQAPQTDDRWQQDHVRRQKEHSSSQKTDQHGASNTDTSKRPDRKPYDLNATSKDGPNEHP